jgi:putative ABC transport system permease protein
MGRFLQDFAYRTPLSPWIYAIAGLLALAIAWLTVGYQTIRAASANPADALRIE